MTLVWRKSRFHQPLSSATAMYCGTPAAIIMLCSREAAGGFSCVPNEMKQSASLSTLMIVGLDMAGFLGERGNITQMTAEIYHLRDYQSKKDLARMYGETTLEQQAIGIVDYINGLIPYGGAGIDGMDVTQANAFHAPENDSA